MRIILSTIVIILACTVQAVLAQEATITITGNGQVAQAPDMATISTGVFSREETAAEALADNSERMQAVMAVLTKAGIAQRDIQTSGFSVQPDYRSNKKTRMGERVPDGYVVANGVTVRIRDVGQLGPMIDRLVGAGADRLGSIYFGFADPAPLLAEARKRAVADARLTAETYAAAAGVKLGPILSIAEPTSYAGPGPMAALAARADTPVALGESSLTASITIVWQIDAAD